MPGTTNASLVLAVGRYLHQHPDATDEEIAEAVGLNLRFDMDTVIRPARQNAAANRSERTDLTGGYRSWEPG
jgi:hypothetical protein